MFRAVWFIDSGLIRSLGMRGCGAGTGVIGVQGFRVYGGAAAKEALHQTYGPIGGLLDILEKQ